MIAMHQAVQPVFGHGSQLDQPPAVGNQGAQFAHFDRRHPNLRHQIGCQKASQTIDELPGGSKVALERLTVKDMRCKSRQMNRALRTSQLGFVRDKLKFKLDERSIRYLRCSQPIPANRVPKVG